MATKTLQRIIKIRELLDFVSSQKVIFRSIVSKRSGAYFPKPKQVPWGMICVVLTVIPGLLVGASISKTTANFLEENELFVPSDDDDDDD